MDSLSQLERYLPANIRRQIEEQYLAPINARARLEQAMHDPELYKDPDHYPPFYADHGVVHHRDVAQQILRVLDTIHGLLIPARDPARLAFMKGYGVLLAFVHDIGMVDFSHFGRATHPESATQAIFSSKWDDIVERIWSANCGNLAWRLSQLANLGALEQEPVLVMREMLAMANCHSKSRLSVDTLSQPQELRKAMQHRVVTDLRHQYRAQQAEKARSALQAAQEEQDHAAVDRLSELLFEADSALEDGKPEAGSVASNLERLHQMYDDFRRDSYLWLVSPLQETRALVSDVVDTLRALRCADALRQRGTTLKTSGGYEILIDQKTANALYALRMGEHELFLLEVSNSIAAGEANIASSELDRDGNLRISFHRGAFQDRDTIRRAAYNAALVVHDIQGDAIDTFRRPFGIGDETNIRKSAEDMEILLEGVDDNLEFTATVQAELKRINPEVAARARAVPSLQSASAFELARYLQAEALDWGIATRREALTRIAKSGHKTEGIDVERGFADVKPIRLRPGELLIEAGTPSGFVYIPLGEGLRVLPLGGYASAMAHPWMPLGLTGVIRGGVRNATVAAEEALTVLAIPKEVYLREWHQTRSVVEVTQLLERRAAADQEDASTGLTGLEKVMALQAVPLFAEIPTTVMVEVASRVRELSIRAGETVFEKGDPGDSMYVIVEGQVRIRDGEHTLNHLGKREVFGEMALLDPEPRMASVSADADTRLLRLEREPFQDLMAQHPTMTQGVIRVLLERLRAEAQEVVKLQSRVQALEERQGRSPTGS